MLGFEKVNSNPKNKKTGDCVIRALATANGSNYFEVVHELVEIYIKTGFHIADKKCYEKWLEQKGFVKYKQPRYEDNTKYLVGDLDKLINTKKYKIVVSLANHIVAVENKSIVDLWDCRNKTIGNYYLKAI